MVMADAPAQTAPTTNVKPSLSPRVIAARMVVYTAAFLSVILWLLPMGFHRLGRFVGVQTIATPLIDAVSPVHHYLGAALFVFALTGYMISSLWLVLIGKGPFVEFDPPREFVASGPYRWMRNPVAASLILTVLGEAVFFGSVGIAFFVLIGLPLAHIQVTRIEEPRLRQRFGESYEAYCRTVPRWWPRRPQDT
jgi:protein-S-isoprenylcysteine O-methyltransferase Ste14